MKKLVLLAVVATFMVATSAMADTIAWSGAFNITGNGSGTVTLTFSPGSILSATNPNNTADTTLVANGGQANYSLTFVTSTAAVTNYSVGSGVFAPGSTNLSLGDAVDGKATGTLAYLSMTNAAPGNFAITLNFTGVTYTLGTGPADAALQSLTSNGAGGSLTYQFSANGVTDVNSLANFNGSVNSSYSASLSAVPEPASLALLGSGLLAGGNFVRRKYAKR